MRTLLPLAFLLITTNIQAAPILRADLPGKDIKILHASPRVEDVRFEVNEDASRVQLISNLSLTWMQGITFDLKEGWVNIPAFSSAFGSEVYR